jgi:DNA-binding MarR family transcriptional regulator
MTLQLIFSVHRATHRIGLYIQRHMPDLNQAEAHILCHLFESGGAAVSELHRAFAHKRSTLTSVLDRLVERGLVTRDPHESDRRSFAIGLTKLGKAKAAKVHRCLETLEAEVLSESTGKSIQTFHQIMQRLERSADVH